MERLHFDTVVEGLWKRAVGDRLDEKLRAALKAEGLDLDKQPLDPAFPAEKMHVWVKLTARSLYPDDDEPTALRKLIELTLTDVNGLPSYYQGIIEEGGRATGAADMTSTFTLRADGSCVYRVTWSEK